MVYNQNPQALSEDVQSASLFPAIPKRMRMYVSPLVTFTFPMLQLGKVA